MWTVRVRSTHDDKPPTTPTAQVSRRQVCTAIKNAVVIDYKKFRGVIRTEIATFMADLAKSGRLDMSEDNEL